jgi:hypothetical protein
MLTVLAAAAAAAAAASPAPPEVDTVEVVARAPVVGTLQQGIQAYTPQFFTAVRPGTAFDMVQWLPGFTFEETRDVRGLAGAAGNVLIDGQPPTSKNDTLSTVLRRIPAEQVDRVDIIVGGAPGIDMRGRTVIANVVLKKTAAPQGSASISTQIYQDGRLVPELQISVTRRRNERTFEGSLTAASRVISGGGVGTGRLVRTGPDGAELFDAASDIAGRVNVVQGAGAYEFPWAGGKLKLNASGIYQDVDAAERAEVSGGPSVYTIDVVDHYRQAELGARYLRTAGRFGFETQALQRLNRHTQDNGTVRPPVLSHLEEEDTLSESVLRSTLRFKRDDKLGFEASAEGAYNSFDTTSDVTRNGLPVKLPAEDVKVAETRGEFGLLATWKPGDRFTSTAAVKVETSALEASGDLSLKRDFTYAKPRVVLAWTPDKRTQLRLRGEHEVNQINFGSFAASIDNGSGVVRAGNPDLRPQRAWVSEAALERQFWPGASAVVTLRYSALRDVVEWRALPAYGNAIAVGNIGDGKRTDLIATVTLPLRRLGLDGMNLKTTANWRWSEVTDPTTGDLRPLGGLSAFVAEAHFSHDLPDWKMIWGVDAFFNSPSSGPRPTTIDRTGANLRLSAFVEYRIKPDLNLRVEAFNLNDEHQPWVVESYGGLRGAAPLLYTETRRNGVGPYLFVRLRKTIS